MSSQRSRSQGVRWNDITQVQRLNQQKPHLWFNFIVVTVAAAVGYILYNLIYNWIVLEVSLGVVQFEFYKHIRMVILIVLLGFVGLVLSAQGVHAVMTSYRYRQRTYKLEQEKKKQTGEKKGQQQESWRYQLGSLSGQVPEISTPARAPLELTQRTNHGRIGGRGMFFPESDKLLKGSTGTRLNFDQFHSPMQYNGQQQSRLRDSVEQNQLVDKYSIDKYYPAVNIMGNGGVQATGLGTTTPPQIVQKVMLRLNLNDKVMQVWTDRLRQWLASQVLKPLIQKIVTAHQDVNEKAGQLGININLPPLDSATSVPTHQRPQQNQQSGFQTALLLREQLQHTLNALQKQNTSTLVTPQNQQQKEIQIKQVQACLRAVTQYFYLCQLLNGQFVKCEMLLGSSRYVTQRIIQLGSGSCVGSFIWNGGGNFNEQAWNPSLPTDTALVFYVLSAFLKAPNWIWPEGDPQSYVSSSSGPLFLGEIPVRAPERFIAVVTNKPGVVSKFATVVCALLQPQNPQFSLMFEGQEYVQQQLGGKLGGHSLKLYGLDKVITPVAGKFTVMPDKWFGLW